MKKKINKAFPSTTLKKMRTEAGLSQKALADMIGISRETVVAIEREYPGAINSLKLQLIRKWREACENNGEGIGKPTKQAFEHAITRYLSFG